MTLEQLQKDPISNYLHKLAQAESGGKSDAKNPYGSAAGLLQFTNSTWQALSDKYKLGYTLEDRYDPEKAQKVGKLFTQENEKVLQPIIGREINDTDRYMAHFLGAGGASKFFQVYNQNPDAPISTVMSKKTMDINKIYTYNKDGSEKTLNQVYAKLSEKMNVTPENVTQEFRNYDMLTPIPNFETSPAALQTFPDTTTEEQSQVEEAQKQLQQQTNEHNFLQDYLAQQPQQRTVQQPVQIQETPAPNLLEQYAQISALVENPTMQSGGQVPVSINGVYDYPKQQVIVPDSNITMKGVNYPILGKSLETGEQKLMMPNSNINYFFNNTQNVLETPLIKR